MKWKRSVPSRSELHDAKREAILREAAASFNRRGFFGTSLDDVAKSLGVTKAAIYYYFPNKHAVLKACIDSAMEAAFENLERARREGRSGRDKLRLTLTGYVEHIVGELSISVVALVDDGFGSKESSAIKQDRDRFEYALRDLVREGIEDGSIVPCDPKLVVFLILGAVNWIPRWFKQDGSWTASQLAAATAELLDRAISSQPSASLTPDLTEVRSVENH